MTRGLKAVGYNEPTVPLSEWQQRALRVLDETRERVLAGGGRTLLCVMTLDPPAADEEAAVVTAADWTCRKGINHYEVVGVLAQTQARMALTSNDER